MKQLFRAADAYIAGCNWQDLALLKICLYSMGLLAGLCIPFRSKKTVGLLAAVAVVLTYIPLMSRFLPYLAEVRGFGLGGDRAGSVEIY